HTGRKPQVAALHAVVAEATAQLIRRKPLALVDRLPRAVLQCAEIIQYCLGAQTMRLRLLNGPKPVGTVRRSSNNRRLRLTGVSRATVTSAKAASRAFCGHSPPARSATTSNGSHASAWRSSTPAGISRACRLGVLEHGPGPHRQALTNRLSFPD